ncbi:MAG: zinc ABC transporter substrate-binding protein [Frankiaceae bacterium]|nr:zinc ABC transporter substrate-binding protein [Frankiaceae bacterium]MBV9871560.1 zinc ABC transporter substrate-binding protein [Frankiaceae bacterium]
MARLLLALAALAISCSGCSTIPARASDGRLQVVAGENFWGDLARQVGGDRVDVTSLINSPDADPHLFEPGTSSGLAVAGADVVIVNGADYDGFMDRLIAAAPSTSRQVVSVADVLHAAGSDVNPHFWYDVPRLPDVVRAIGAAMQTADPAHAAHYRRGVAATIRSLHPLQAAVAGLSDGFSGTPVAYTERVPGYLLAAAHLRVIPVASFTHAIESGVDPSFADIAAMRDLITGHRIRALLVNEQAQTTIVDQLVSLARNDGVAVVGVTETRPASTTFERWQLDQIRALDNALAR